jgi:hypothetical protein
VNSKLAQEYFSEYLTKQKISMLEFRQKLADEMINYGRPVHPDDDSPRNKWHRATTIPPMSCCIHNHSLENGLMADGKGAKLSTYDDFVLVEKERGLIVNVIP